MSIKVYLISIAVALTTVGCVAFPDDGTYYSNSAYPAYYYSNYAGYYNGGYQPVYHNYVWETDRIIYKNDYTRWQRDRNQQIRYQQHRQRYLANPRSSQWDQRRADTQRRQWDQRNDEQRRQWNQKRDEQRRLWEQKRTDTQRQQWNQRRDEQRRLWDQRHSDTQRRGQWNTNRVQQNAQNNRPKQNNSQQNRKRWSDQRNQNDRH
nr:hypothetical protein [Acinetobacter sp. Marseille-Q1620]